MSDADYGVEWVPGGVRVKLGEGIAPFDVPRGIGIKLALLILKKAGCNVRITEDGAIINFGESKGFSS